jgi:Domain of unknown function (DUF4394)
MKTLTSLNSLIIYTILSFSFFSCKKESQFSEIPPTEDQIIQQSLARVAPSIKSFYALTSNNELVNYVSNNQIMESAMLPITGLMASEKILAIDFRPATGQLYGVSTQNRIYVINSNSGLASAIGATPFSIDALGDHVGFDFNPTVDRIRLVTSKGNNFRLNPETGAIVATDGIISIPTANIVGSAYTNSMAGASSTTLYNIDAASDKLYKQDPPNNGTLVEVGSLGVQVVGQVGFDISTDNNIGIAAIFGRGYEAGQKEESNGNKYRFYCIDLATGEAKNIGKTDREIIGLAVPTNMVTYAVDNSNNLMIMNPSAGSIIPKAITGLDVGAKIVGIDMRPATGQLYGLASNSRLYSINMANGVATAIGTGPFTPALSGTSFGFDFNPTVDRIRIVSNTGQNLRAHPVTGLVAATDGAIKPGTPAIDAVAYTNSFIGTTSTTLFDIDVDSDMLYIQSPPNDGLLTMPKPLGIDVSASSGFDIGGKSNNAWGIFNVGGVYGLYNVDLATGKATNLMSISSTVSGFAVGLGF